MHISDPRAWSDLIRNHLLDAKHNEVLSLFLEKVRCPYGFRPEHFVLSSVLKSCTVLSAADVGRPLHSFTLKMGHLSCLSVAKGLLNFYAKSGEFVQCNKLLFEIPKFDTVVFNIVLSGFSKSKDHDTEAARLFCSIHARGDPKPSPITVAIVLPIFSRLGILSAGKSVHSYMVKSGIELSTLSGNALTSMYSKFGHVSIDAYRAFHEITDKDMISWNAIISGFSENGLNYNAYLMFRNMLKESIEPNHITIASVLPIFASMDRNIAGLLGKELHAYVQRRVELQTDTSIVNALLSFYLRIGQSRESEFLFRRMTLRDTISWNAMIAGYVLNKEWLNALHLFLELVSGYGGVLDSVTLISILPAFASLKNLRLGKQIHSYVIQHPEVHDDGAIRNALMSFYAKCGDVDASYKIFSMSSQRDLISWNAMLDAFARRGNEPRLINLFCSMFQEDIRPDSITMSVVVRFFGDLCSSTKVKEAHGYLLRAFHFHGGAEPILTTIVLDAYGKCGNVDYALKIFDNVFRDSVTDSCDSMMFRFFSRSSHIDACKLFENVSAADLIIWNSMIHILVENGFLSEALNLFHELQVLGVKPDAATIMSILPVCYRMTSIHLLRQFHGYVIRACLKDDHLMAALIDIYSKCGSIISAHKLFHLSTHTDLVIFTSMIVGYATNGMGEESLKVYKHLLHLGLRPDDVTITAVLSACSHVGFVEEGLSIFHSMQKLYGIQPTIEHHACVVDLLARGGRVKDAYDFVSEMPVEANAKIWSTLLNACRTYNEHELGQIIATQLVSVEAKDIGSHVSISNMYAADARWDEVLEIRKGIKRTGSSNKPAGWSWVE